MDKIELFRQDLQLQGLSAGTVYRHVLNTRRFVEWAQTHGLDPVRGSHDDLRAYLAELRSSRKLRPVSLSAIFISLNSWYLYCADRGMVAQNPVPEFRRRYLRQYKGEIRRRKLISVKEATKMVRATIDSRDRAILMILLKTGIRKGELMSLDIDNVDMPGCRLNLKATPKRSNRIVFFDDEAARALSRWLKSRELRCVMPGEKALFVSLLGTRLQSTGVQDLVRDAAIRVGLHDVTSDRLEDHFSPHCCRHWNATHLLRAGMSRDYVKWLRGDAMKEAIDIYYHIDPEDVRKSYLAHIPQLGV